MRDRGPSARRDVALLRLPRTLKYKAQPGRDVDQLESELLRLLDFIESLAAAPVRYPSPLTPIGRPRAAG